MNEGTKRIRETLRRLDRPKKGLTRPIPKDAESVVEILRRDVERPSFLPVGNPLRFDMVLVKRKTLTKRVIDGNGLGWSCPMGLHPDANGRDEPCGIPFGDAGEIFSAWWDEQEDAEAATKAVWGY